ncbi:hypothetical protein N0V82_001150 [Gnomoniopsis sp. IMI 355080]|nr:hypothetical protein N0V82_001150 [Gnomoniopsis sp. IMI 355080]
MIAPTAKSATAPGAESWDEAKIEQALKNLNDLHIQLRELRSTIPRMQERLGGPVASAGELVTVVKGATQAAFNEVEEYKKNATDPENIKILDRAKQSRNQNPKGIKPWRAKDHPDWLTPST